MIRLNARQQKALDEAEAELEGCVQVLWLFGLEEPEIIERVHRIVSDYGAITERGPHSVHAAAR
jgi:hypothetical protein